MHKLTVFWLRRDLRLFDNKAFYYALKESRQVLPVFIFDTNILDELEDKYDKRITFIHQAISELKQELEQYNSSLLIKHGDSYEVFREMIKTYHVEGIYFNVDYEPYAIQRDRKIHELCQQNTIPVKSYKDQVIYDTTDVVKDNGKPYSVFTPYMKKWKSTLNEKDLAEYPTQKFFHKLYKCQPFNLIEIEQLGFQRTKQVFPSKDINETIIKNYNEYRDYPAMDYTSRLGIHLRFGTLSIRNLVQKALELNETWLNQLIWREFFMMILWHHPELEDQAFKKKYDHIDWRNSEKEFILWTQGKTGYPIVDAGMRQLNETGYMHNRVRMITASFLIKHLLIDWRWGETYFAQRLLDYELASNNGGWQWAAGSGCDAAPYFRIFNPERQTVRFDPDKQYIKKWVPEYGTNKYPAPIVEHQFARERALNEYKKALNK
jgi:deoxyribodipyrimidine photo-lyase